jgi:hypothetical protein
MAKSSYRSLAEWVNPGSPVEHEVVGGVAGEDVCYVIRIGPSPHHHIEFVGSVAVADAVVNVVLYAHDGLV